MVRVMAELLAEEGINSTCPPDEPAPDKVKLLPVLLNILVVNAPSLALGINNLLLPLNISILPSTANFELASPGEPFTPSVPVKVVEPSIVALPLTDNEPVN